MINLFLFSLSFSRSAETKIGEPFKSLGCSDKLGLCNGLCIIYTRLSSTYPHCRSGFFSRVSIMENGIACRFSIMVMISTECVTVLHAI